MLNWGPTARGIKLVVNPQEAEFDALLGNQPPIWALDVEDNEEGKFVGVGLYDGKTCFYFSELFSWLIKHLESPFIAHNGKSDLHKMKKWGINTSSSQLAFDTMVASYTLDPTRDSNGLKPLSKELLGIEYPSYKEIVGIGKKKLTLDKQPVELVSEYNAMDCVCTWMLARYFESQFTPEQAKYFADIEMPIFRILWDMEDAGIQLDTERLARFDGRLLGMREMLRARIERELGRINLNSPVQLLAALNSSGANLESTSASVLEEYKNIPLIADLLQYREVDKLKGTYTEAFLKMGGTVHADFIPDTGTGRFACRNPNLQNQPSHSQLGLEMRSCFIPRPGYSFILADYSQIELRVLAHFSKDKLLTEAFLTDQDVHQVTAKAIDADRTVAKTINFAIVYGSGAWNLHQKTGITFDAAEKFMNTFSKKFWGVYDWKAKTIYEAQKYGYVETLLGRRVKRYLTLNCKKHSKKSVNKGKPCRSGCEQRLEAEADRRVISAVVQGSAAEIIKLAMIKLTGLGIKYLIQEHDALLFEVLTPKVDTYKIAIRETMENAVKLSVPLKVDISMGDSWGRCKSK